MKAPPRATPEVSTARPGKMWDGPRPSSYWGGHSASDPKDPNQTGFDFGMAPGLGAPEPSLENAQAPSSSRDLAANDFETPLGGASDAARAAFLRDPNHPERGLEGGV